MTLQGMFLQRFWVTKRFTEALPAPLLRLTDVTSLRSLDLIGNAWQMDSIGQNKRIDSLCVGGDSYTVVIDGGCFEIVVVPNEQDVIVFGMAVANGDESESLPFLGNRILVGVRVSFQIEAEPGQILPIDDTDKVFSL